MKEDIQDVYLPVGCTILIVLGLLSILLSPMMSTSEIASRFGSILAVFVLFFGVIAMVTFSVSWIWIRLAGSNTVEYLSSYETSEESNLAFQLLTTHLENLFHNEIIKGYSLMGVYDYEKLTELKLKKDDMLLPMIFVNILLVKPSKNHIPKEMKKIETEFSLHNLTHSQ